MTKKEDDGDQDRYPSWHTFGRDQKAEGKRLKKTKRQKNEDGEDGDKNCHPAWHAFWWDQKAEDKFHMALSLSKCMSCKK